MDIFAQKKLLIRIIILLSLMNLFFIGVFLWKDFIQKPPRQNNPDNFRDVSAILKRELDLTENQVEQIKNLRSGYFEKEKSLVLAIRNERDSMNVILFSKNTSEELVKTLAARVAENEYKMELLRFEQAQELKSICNPQQLQKFEGLVLEIRDYFRPDNIPKKN